MKKLLLTIGLGLLLIPIPGLGQSQDTLRVLFVGNSYTYFWNLPQSVEAMAVSQEIPLIARQSTAGGVDWRQHWEGKKELKSKELITEGNWDVVVLQNHSLSAIEKPEEFKTYGDKFIKLIKKSGARPVLYMTWARSFNPLMQSQISQTYKELAEEHEIELIRVGEMWSESLRLRPNFNLFDKDESHPSPEGTYLTACLFYRYLTGRSADALPHRIKTTDRNGEELYLLIMPEDDADYMQQLADLFAKTKESGDE